VRSFFVQDSCLAMLGRCVAPTKLGPLGKCGGGGGWQEGKGAPEGAVQRCKTAYGLCKRAKVCGEGRDWVGRLLSPSFCASCIEVGLALRANLAAA
jgi:hypothetical protein